jgi:hypothetical protein
LPALATREVQKIGADGEPRAASEIFDVNTNEPIRRWKREPPSEKGYPNFKIRRTGKPGRYILPGEHESRSFADDFEARMKDLRRRIRAERGLS